MSGRPGEPADRFTVRVDRALEDLVPGFLARRHEEVVSLASRLEAGDLDGIRVTGHSLKGTGGGYGFDGLTEIGAEIERAATAAERDAIAAAIERLRDYLARVDVEFE